MPVTKVFMHRQTRRPSITGPGPAPTLKAMLCLFSIAGIWAGPAVPDAAAQDRAHRDTVAIQSDPAAGTAQPVGTIQLAQGQLAQIQLVQSDYPKTARRA